MDHQTPDRAEGSEISITMKAKDESKTSELPKDPEENEKQGGTSRTKTNILQKNEETQTEEKDDHVIEMESETKLEHGEETSTRAEKVCRICHLGTEHSSGSSDLIQLGCSCKAELGLSHRRCAESWFKQRGNRLCEICGKTARNITGIEVVRPTAIEWNGAMITLTTNSYPLPEESSRSCRQSICNILLACLILAFTLPWFFHIHTIW